MNTYYEFLGTLEEEEDVADVPCVGCGQRAEDKWLRKGRNKTNENTLYTCTPCSKSDCRAERILIDETKALYEVAGLCEDESLVCTTCSKAQAYAVVVNKGLNTKDTKNHIPFCAECFRLGGFELPEDLDTQSPEEGEEEDASGDKQNSPEIPK